MFFHHGKKNRKSTNWAALGFSFAFASGKEHELFELGSLCCCVIVLWHTQGPGKYGGNRRRECGTSGRTHQCKCASEFASEFVTIQEALRLEWRGAGVDGMGSERQTLTRAYMYLLKQPAEK